MKKDDLSQTESVEHGHITMSVRDDWSSISQKSLSLSFLRVSLYQHMSVNTFRSIDRRQKAIRDDFKLYNKE